MQVTNPYLPSYEYVPDGEPHVFGDRVYLFGSHDRFNGQKYCENDYVCWSAPVKDLSDWRYEGVIYRKVQDPFNVDGRYSMFAPDVTRGSDGRFYLYYGLEFVNRIGVAVSDSPAGPYAYYGNVHYPDGTLYGNKEKEVFRFDPAVLNDDGRIWLYTGFCPTDPFFQKFLPNITVDALGNTVVELASDMLTIISEPKRMIPGKHNSAGTGFEGHEFYEASSIRKFGSKYYFIYSSFLSHELAYAVSNHPDRDFQFAGALHSNGNIGYEDNLQAMNYWGNNHGSVEYINGNYYVFGHRQTNQHELSRQGVAEMLQISQDGAFCMAQMTSCGLNGGPLRCEGSYEASIACVLIGPAGACKTTLSQEEKPLHPYITQDGSDRESHPKQYIANILSGTIIGYKYFDIAQATTPITLTLRSHRRPLAKGKILMSTTLDFSSVCGSIDVEASEIESNHTCTMQLPMGQQALYIKYEGCGSIDLMALTW